MTEADADLELEDGQLEDGQIEEGDSDDGDDEIIAVAFRRSLYAVGVLVLITGTVWWALSRAPEAPPEQDLEAPAPVAVTAPGEESLPALPFTDVTASSGIDFVHENGARGDKWLPETMGGGVAFFDVDSDGDPDLLFVSSAPWPDAGVSETRPSLRLYLNDGAGQFADVTEASGLDQAPYAMGAVVGDYDGDGDGDLYVTAVGENLLLRNDSGVFVDVTVDAGVAGDADSWSTGAAFVDLDGDLDLDLFVCNYVQWSPAIDEALDFRLDGVGRAYGPPQDYRGTVPYLFRNEGDGTFSEVGAESGVHVLSPSGEPMAKALAVLPTDADGDGLIDLLIANDTVRNFFFLNRTGLNGDGHAQDGHAQAAVRFEEVGELYGLAYDRNGRATGAMGIDSARHRGDSNLAFAIGNFANEMSSIYVSQDDPSFYVDEAIAEGIGAATRQPLTFGLLFADFDLDGRQDLLQVNGHIEDGIASVDSSQSYLQPAQIFWNAGVNGFLEAPSIGALAQPLAGRGAAAADIDGDGDLDLAVAQNGGPGLLLRNDQQAGHRWLRLRLSSEAPNTAAFGAQVEVVSSTGHIQRLEVRPTRSYLSQVESVLTVGLGEADSAQEVRVRWPDGSESRHVELEAGQLHVLSAP